MNSKRLYFGLVGLIGLLFVGLLAGAYGANSLLGTQANTLISLKAKNQALTEQQQSLAVAKKDIKKYAGLEKIAQTVVPQDKDQAEAVREIVNLAAGSSVALGSITFPTSTLGLGVAGSSSSSGSSAPTPSLPVGASKNANLSQLVAVKGAPGVYSLVITVTSDQNHPAQYNQLINFLSGLEHNRRTAQVSSIILQPATQSPGGLTFTITLNEYIKP